MADPQTARLAEVETLLTLAESMALVAREGPDLDGVRRGSADVIEQLCAALRASETARLQLKPVYEKALKHMRGLYARQTERDTEDLKQLLAEAEPAKQQAEQERDTYRATTREWIAANAPGGWIDNLRASLAQREAEIARQVEQARADVFAQVEAEATRRAPQELRQSDYDQGRWHAYTELADWCQQQKGQG